MTNTCAFNLTNIKFADSAINYHCVFLGLLLQITEHMFERNVIKHLVTPLLIAPSVDRRTQTASFLV